MTTDLRSALRIAHRVRQQLLETRARRIVDASQQLERWRGRVDHLRHPNRHALLAHDNRWAAGARRSANAARRQLRELSCDLPSIQRLYEQIAEVHIPGLRDLLKELDQIEDEFGSWRLQPNPDRLAVCTCPIVLEGIELGSFDIQLHLDDLSGLCNRQPYDIVALDPNPAQSNDSVTHPHVSDEGLCEGNAIHPIRLALSGGRLAEFFLIVRSVLETYNPDSPYVRLDQWTGTPCDDCGYRVDSECRCFCDRCDREYCDQCIDGCKCCGNTECFRCLSECPACGDASCLDCLNVCDGCSERCCTDCLTDYLCPTCHNERNEPHDNSNNSQDPEPVQGAQAPPPCSLVQHAESVGPPEGVVAGPVQHSDIQDDQARCVQAAVAVDGPEHTGRT